MEVVGFVDEDCGGWCVGEIGEASAEFGVGDELEFCGDLPAGSEGGALPRCAEAGGDDDVDGFVGAFLKQSAGDGEAHAGFAEADGVGEDGAAELADVGEGAGDGGGLEIGEGFLVGLCLVLGLIGVEGKGAG